jgi:outer membrane assembly lipoprotein YfgL
MDLVMNALNFATAPRAWISALLVGASVLTLSGCGTSKPEPARLEALQPSAKVTVIWQQRTDNTDALLSMSLSDGTLVAATTRGEISAWSAATGQQRWRGTVNANLSAAVGSDGRYAAVVTQSNELQVLDQGRVIWREALPGRVTTPPLVAGERVFVKMLDRYVRAYDVVDGRWLWQYQRPGGDTLALATRGVLSAFRDTLLVGQGSRLVGLDPTRGTVRFDINVGTPRGTNEVERLADLVGPLARADDEACVRTFQLSVACLELNRGSVRWSRPQAGTQAVAADERIVVAADSADRVNAWKMDNGESLWRVDRFLRRQLSAPVIWGQHAAVVDEEGYLHVLALADGRTVARLELDAPLAGAPLVSGDVLLVSTRKGTIQALRLN